MRDKTLIWIVALAVIAYGTGAVALIDMAFGGAQ